MLWLVPVIALLATLGSGNVFSQIAVFFSKMADGDVRGRLRGARLRRPAGGRELRLAQARRDARRPRHGRDHARAADHGAAVRRLHGGVPRSRNAVADGRRHARRPAGDLGHLHALLSLDIPGRALHRGLRGNKALNGALSAITAAVVGVVLNLAIWFALHTVFRESLPVHGYGLRFDMPVLTSVDPWALALSVAAIVAIFRFKVGMITDAAGLLDRRHRSPSRGRRSRDPQSHERAARMTYTMKPLGCDPARIKGMSERLIVSHYENNYGGAVKRLNLIEEQLAELDYAKAAGFLINGLKREQLIAMNSMILHELFFDGLGDQSEPGTALREALARDFGSYERWRSEFIAMGKALGGGSGWVLLSWSPRDRKLVNQWASDHCHTLAGGTPNSRARYVRALLSHRFRRQGRGLCRHVHGCHPLEQRGAGIRSNDNWSRERGRYRAMSPTKEERSCVLFTCSRFAPWRRSAPPPAPRTSTGRRSTRR